MYTLWGWCSVVPVLFVRVPCDSREQHCSSCLFPGKSPYSSLQCWFHPVSASEQLTVSPHRLSDHSLGNHLRACGDRHICVKVSACVSVYVCMYSTVPTLRKCPWSCCHAVSGQFCSDRTGRRGDSAPLSAWLSVPGFVYCDGTTC